MFFGWMTEKPLHFSYKKMKLFYLLLIKHHLLWCFLIFIAVGGSWFCVFMHQSIKKPALKVKWIFFINKQLSLEEPAHFCTHGFLRSNPLCRVLKIFFSVHLNFLNVFNGSFTFPPNAPSQTRNSHLPQHTEVSSWWNQTDVWYWLDIHVDHPVIVGIPSN